MIEVVCVCGEKQRVPDERAGQSIACPNCRGTVAVPGPGKVPETIPPPGLRIDPGLTERPDVTPPAPLVEAVERLIGIGRGIQALLAGILVVLALLLLQSWRGR